MTTLPQQGDIEGKLMQVSLRVTSMGNALMHEMTGAGRPDDGGIRFSRCRWWHAVQYGHMHHAVFTEIDANHHTEDWTYMMPGDNPVHAHTDLQRTK